MNGFVGVNPLPPFFTLADVVAIYCGSKNKLIFGSEVGVGAAGLGLITGLGAGVGLGVSEGSGLGVAMGVGRRVADGETERFGETSADDLGEGPHPAT